MPRGFSKKLTAEQLEERKEKKTRFYRIWFGINYRCNDERSPGWNIYGGRGIKCLWKNYNDFKSDMYESYLNSVAVNGEIDTTIDRIDWKGHYCKENCRWATRYEQTQNRNEDYVRRGNTTKGKTKYSRDIKKTT